MRPFLASFLSLSLLIGGSLMPAPAAAHVFAEARLVVNVLPGNTQTDKQIQDLVSGVNQIFAQCGNIAFSLAAGDIKRQAAFPKGFDARGNTLLSDKVTDKEHLAAANPEIKNGGYKIFLAEIVESGGNAINGATFDGKPVSEIAQREKPPRQAQGDSQTWAHEIAHGLGLDHVGDGNNLMFEDRLRKDGTPAGTDLDEETQCKKIRAAFLKLGPVVEVTVDQLGVDPGTHSTFVAVTDETAADFKTGEALASAGYLSVHAVELHRVRSGLGDRLDLTLYKDAPMPAGRELAATYTVLFDADSDPETGGVLAGQPGIDATMEITVEGRAPFDGLRGRLTAIAGRLDPAAGWVFSGLPEVRWQREEKAGAAAPGLSSDVLEVSLPTAALGPLADEIGLAWTTAGEGCGQVAPLQEALVTTERPTLNPGSFVVRPGEPLILTGTGFTPGSKISAFWGRDFQKPVITGTVDGSGAVDLSMTVPEVPAGNGPLTLIDDQGRFQIAVVTVGR